MNKLYPPLLEKTVPAFFGSTLNIDFQLNKAVTLDQVDEMKLIIKSTSTNQEKLNTKSTNIYLLNDQVYRVVFDNISDLVIGQFYKIQICFVNNSVEGYYSTAAIVKYTGEPTISIKGIEYVAGGTTQIQQEIVGIYENKQDSLEKVYTYKFDLYDVNNNLLTTSAIQYHDNKLNISAYESHDAWEIDYNLIPYEIYYIQYTVQTLNGLTLSSPKYAVTLQDTIKITPRFNLYFNFEPDNGYIEISMECNTTDAITNKIIILRSDKENKWTEMCEVDMLAWYSTSPQPIFKDFTIEHGLEYQYAAQLVNSHGLRSDKILASDILSINQENKNYKAYVDFEDIFLMDGERQLKVRFDPKVNNFKNTILEQKTDTIGGPYPYFFRNGNVKYKEFSISGLISMLMDENCYFMKEWTTIPERTRERTISPKITIPEKSTNLVSENIKKEKDFKLEVLEWLTNGKPKLFRSPTEGNYIVRLMNTSLTPNDTLGRMLHTFSSTAYEIADNTFKNYIAFGFINKHLTLETKNPELIIQQIDISKDFMIECPQKIVFAYFINGHPGASFNYSLGKEQILSGTIGITNEFYIPNEFFKQEEINTISIFNNTDAMTMVYGYIKGSINDAFNNIANISINPVPQYRQRTTSEETVELLASNLSNLADIPSRTLSSKYLEDIRKKVGKVYYLRLSTIPNVEINSNNHKCSITINGETTNYDFTPQNMTKDNIILPNYPVRVESDIILYNIDKLESLIISPGVLVEILYQEKEIYYSFEDNEKLNEVIKLANEVRKLYPNIPDSKLVEYNNKYHFYYNNVLAPKWREVL